MIKLLVYLIALVVGGWMIFDGVHVLATGKYFGPEKPGPWSDLAAAVGVDPFRLGPLFIAVGAMWLTSAAAIMLGQNWGWYAALITAAVTLLYLPVGTVLSVVYIALLIVFRSRFFPGS